MSDNNTNNIVTYLADKSTLDETNELIKNQKDVINNQSEIINSIKINAEESNNKLNTVDLSFGSISNGLFGDGSALSGYGNGSMGDVTYDPDVTVWPAKDGYGRYVWNCTNFTLPEGITMTPPEKCNGLYIYSTVSCTINGTIDMRNKRLTLSGSNGISNFIVVSGNKYELAKGGNTVKGGDGGYAGKFGKVYDESVNATNAKCVYFGGKALDAVNGGHINGGGNSTYGTRAKSVDNGASFTSYLQQGAEYWEESDYKSMPASGKTSAYQPAPGAIILASPTLTLSATSLLDCSATPGKACTNGTDGEYKAHSELASGFYMSGKCGTGGDGAIAPSGGGCITIIAESLSNVGELNTKGDILTCTGNGAGTDGIYKNGRSTYFCMGGHSGGDGTFISEAGEIKIYIVGGAE